MKAKPTSAKGLSTSRGFGSVFPWEMLKFESSVITTNTYISTYSGRFFELFDTTLESSHRNDL